MCYQIIFRICFFFFLLFTTIRQLLTFIVGFSYTNIQMFFELKICFVSRGKFCWKIYDYWLFRFKGKLFSLMKISIFFFQLTKLLAALLWYIELFPTVYIDLYMWAFDKISIHFREHSGFYLFSFKKRIELKNLLFTIDWVLFAGFVKFVFIYFFYCFSIQYWVTMPVTLYQT